MRSTIGCCSEARAVPARALPAATMTAPSIGDLRRAQPDAVRHLSARLVGHAARLRAASATASALASGSGSGWVGAASAAAGGRHTELVAAIRTLADGLDRCAEAILAAGEQTADARHTLGHADRAARAGGMHLLDSGALVGPGSALPLPSGASAEPARLAERARADYEAALMTLRARLASAAARYAAAPFAPAHPGIDAPAPVASAAGLVPASATSPPPSGPVAARAWFAALTDAERAEVIQEHPDWVGPCDGLPAWARDDANRRLLESTAQRAMAELAALREQPSDGDLSWRDILRPPLPSRRVIDLIATLDGLRVIKEVLAADDGRRRQLLSVAASGSTLTAAVTSGDLDAAGHVAVFVPGFRAEVAGDLATYSRAVEQAADLADRLSQAHGDGRPVVGVTWLGYAAPTVLEVAVPGKSVAGWGPATAGAPTLDRLLAGLDAAGRATNPGDPPRLVLWGHSYGSLVSGLALRDATVPVDAAVVFGSPGMGVDQVSELRLPSGQLYVEEALDDVVAATSRFAADPGQWPEATQLSVAQQVLPDGSVGAIASGHEEYLRPGSTSQWNLAAVAAGTTDLVLRLPACPAWSPLSPQPRPSCQRPMRIG